MATNNTIELTRLPNPTKHEKAQFDTLTSSLGHHKEIDKYSQNVDINTFRTYSESIEGMEKLHKVFKDNNVFSAISVEQGKKLEKNLDPENEDQKSFWGGLKEGLGFAFEEVAKPFKKLRNNLEETGDTVSWFAKTPMETAIGGSEQFGRGVKELANGIGAIGPAMNLFKLAVHKTVAGVNVLTGALRMLVIAPLKTLSKLIAIPLLKGLVFLIKKIPIVGEALDVAMAWVKETWQKTKEAFSNMWGSVKGFFGFGSSETESDDDEKDAVGGGTGPLGTKDDPLFVVSVKEAIEKQSKSILGPDGKALLSDKKEADEERKQSEVEYHKTRLKNAVIEHKLKLKNLKKQAIASLAALLPWLLVGAGLMTLWMKWDDWDPWAGLTTAAQKTISKITGIFTGLGKTLAEKMPRLFGWLAPEVADDAAKAGSGLADDAAKAGSKTTSLADDAAKVATSAGDDVARATGTNLLKAAKVTATKALGPAGAGAEIYMDWTDQNEKFERIKMAYESGEELPMPDGSGNVTMRTITDEEWELIQRAHTANRAGSVGKGTGSLAAAATAATVLSPLLATGPLGWAVYGLGVIGSAVAGGMAGDSVATNLVEGSEIDDAQGMIDNLYKNLPPVEQGADMSNLQTDVDDASASAQTPGGSSSNTAMNIDSSSHTDVRYEKTPDMIDRGLEFATATPSGKLG